MNVWHFLELWLLLSSVLAPLIGHCVHFGMNGPKPMTATMPVKTNQVSYKARRSNEGGWDEFWYWAAICACWGCIAAVFLMGD